MTIKVKTIKIVLATFISILIAQTLNLEYPLAAGIIAILSVLDTKKESITIAFARMGSTVLAFAVASAVFFLLGYSVGTFSLYLLIYVPIAYRFNLQSGIAPCSVLVTHFVTAQSIAIFWQINGLLIMAIGVVIAIVLNLWMPSYEKDLTENVSAIEEELRQFLKTVHSFLLGDADQNALNLKARRLTDLLHETEKIALLDYENQITSRSDYYIRYTQMRIQQVELLKVMIQTLKTVKFETEQNKVLAGLFNEIADQLHEKNTGLTLLEIISTLYRYFRESELPKSRDEFESRASLFQILRDVERFIELKRDFFISSPA